LDELLGRIISTQMAGEVGDRAVIGILAHLVILAKSDQPELSAWLHEPSTFNTWHSVVATSGPRARHAKRVASSSPSNEAA
jgi:hypothetical protein